jgi:hypothetical protein
LSVTSSPSRRLTVLKRTSARQAAAELRARGFEARLKYGWWRPPQRLATVSMAPDPRDLLKRGDEFRLSRKFGCHYAGWEFLENAGRLSSRGPR